MATLQRGGVSPLVATLWNGVEDAARWRRLALMRLQRGDLLSDGDEAATRRRLDLGGDAAARGDVSTLVATLLPDGDEAAVRWCC